MTGRDDACDVSADDETRTIAPLRPQQKTYSGEEARQSMSGESRGRLQRRDGGHVKEIENSLPVCEPTMHRLASSVLQGFM